MEPFRSRLPALAGGQEIGRRALVEEVLASDEQLGPLELREHVADRPPEARVRVVGRERPATAGEAHDELLE